MSTNIKTSRTRRELAAHALIGGLQKHQSTIATLVIGGKAFTPGEIIPILQGRIDTDQGVVAARAIWKTAIKTAQDEQSKTKQFVSGLRAALQVAFAGSVEALFDFGLTPRKVHPLTPVQKLAATAKAKATRAARHTMGSKQKLAVKGDVTGVAVTHVTAPGTVTPTPPATAPAPTPTSPASKLTG